MSQISFENRVISGGFSFSSTADVINVCKSAQELKEDSLKLFLEYAEKAKEVYKEKLAKAKAETEGRVNALTIRRDALNEAKSAIISLYGEEKVNEVLKEFETENARFIREKRAEAKLVSKELKRSKAVKKLTKIDKVPDEVIDGNDPFEL